MQKNAKSYGKKSKYYTCMGAYVFVTEKLIHVSYKNNS